MAYKYPGLPISTSDDILRNHQFLDCKRIAEGSEKSNTQKPNHLLL